VPLSGEGHSGYQAHEGDEVILTNDHGACNMVSKNGSSAQVFVKEYHPGRKAQ
jgi:hypothetical protein